LGDLEHQDRSTQDFSSIAFPVSDTPSVDIIVHLHDEFKAIHKALRSTLCLVLPADTVLQAVNGYIDMFTQYHFPNSPFIFESTLRSCASLLEHVDDGAYSVVLSDQLETMRKFTLITAMCAMVTSVMPESSVRNRHLLSVSFLHASRAMLHAYLDQDLEHPDSSSLIIRTWHSIALQNTSGKTGPAWHQHGEAALLAQRLRLQEEASFSRFPKKESQLLRAIFWQLYLTDVAAIATDTRPPIFHEAFSCGGPDVHQQGSQDEPFLDPRRLHNEGSLETRLITSWHYKIRIWSLAATIIRDVKRLENGPSGLIPDAGLTEEGASASKDLVHAYLRYSGLLDDLPVWIQKPDEAPDSADKQVRAYQSTCFWMQRCSIVSAFHCLKLIILQRCVEYGRPSVMGLTSNESTLAMKKIDIAYDFLRELQRVPFMCLKLQGEIQVSQAS
jgi:hypothetical protein